MAGRRRSSVATRQRRRSAATARSRRSGGAGRAERRRAAALAQPGTARPTAIRGRPSLGLLRDTMAELRRVTWPSVPQARTLTMMVVGVSVAMGLVLGGMDWVFSRLAAVVIGPG